jgi:hypothetical protein
MALLSPTHTAICQLGVGFLTRENNMLPHDSIGNSVHTLVKLLCLPHVTYCHSQQYCLQHSTAFHTNVTNSVTHWSSPSVISRITFRSLICKASKMCGLFLCTICFPLVKIHTFNYIFPNEACALKGCDLLPQKSVSCPYIRACTKFIVLCISVFTFSDTKCHVTCLCYTRHLQTAEHMMVSLPGSTRGLVFLALQSNWGRQVHRHHTPAAGCSGIHQMSPFLLSGQ